MFVMILVAFVVVCADRVMIVVVPCAVVVILRIGTFDVFLAGIPIVAVATAAAPPAPSVAAPVATVAAAAGAVGGPPVAARAVQRGTSMCR